MPLAICKTTQKLQGVLARARENGRIALVPTMGALHAGHQALIQAAKQQAETVVVSIFVNPTQFLPHEDFSRYPRPLEADIHACAAAGADVVYAPEVADMYPPGFATAVTVKGAADGLESVFRPGHFDGVATVVTKLFTRVLPDIALFGEKDYQQLAVIKQLVRDLDMPVVILGVPTLREADGLALSSRNAYLSSAERAIAPRLYALLQEIAAAPDTLAHAPQKLLDAGFAKVDYLALADADTLQTPPFSGRPSRLLAAAWLGTTRLIDNLPVDAS